VTAQLWLIDHAPIMGGAEELLLKLARAASQRADVDVVTVCPGDSELARRSRAAGVDVRGLAMPHFATPAAALIPVGLARMARVLRAAPAATVFVAASAWAQALVAGCAPVLRGRPIVHLLAEQETARRRSARLVLRHIGVPLAVGTNAAATYARALGRDTVAHMNNVLSGAELAAAGACARRQAPRPVREPPVVGALGRLIAAKGALELVDELAAAPAAWSEARLAGAAQDAAYADRVRQRIAQHGLGHRLRLDGRVDDVAAFLDALDVLVVPSTGTEGQPTVILEALARGLQVVVREPMFGADYAGLPVACYHDASDLAAALARLPRAPAPLGEIERRFGAEQAFAALLAAGISPPGG
jgi:glycosyltransferase involved in cell wall biosynthesis